MILLFELLSWSVPDEGEIVLWTLPLRAIEHDMILDIRCRGEDGGIVFISYFIVLLYIRVHCLEIVVFVLSHIFFIISLNTGVDISRMSMQSNDHAC
jgi:hypothetical protein